VSFPPQPQWQAIEPGDARELFRGVFARWGLPRGIRVDNGHPWGLNSGLPPALALWLLGLGVRMAWIPPCEPQYNGKVERGNGVTQQWAEPSSCTSRSALQGNLDRECLIQREKYPSIAGRPRIEAFPELVRIERPYRVDSEGTLWDLSIASSATRCSTGGRTRRARSGCTAGAVALGGSIEARRFV
jgi:hypothetical protein